VFTIVEVCVYNLSVTERGEIREWLIGQIASDMDADVASRAAEHFGITRQAVGRHLRNLLTEGVIVARGHTRARRYELAVLKNYLRTYPLNSAFQEDVVWSQDILPAIGALPANTLDICQYGVTEMLNNAKDHSASETVVVSMKATAAALQIAVQDGGVGIFRKIKDACGLDDERHAILELVKGRLTTDPEHHTGEGVFFTSRAFDVFTILSGSLSLVHRRDGADWLVDDAQPSVGTHVSMKIQPRSTHALQEVFDRYATEQDDYAFRRTHLLVALAQTDGGSLVSRSQAKRVMARCDRFREVILDFAGVASVGPAFADEIFRVWRRAHPNVFLGPSGMNLAVEKMVRRALATETPEKL
jgi:anti-sigma regulatory factor (Ser/Thr protein kinase)/DNA-binding transcriptional ArsR family regulator